MTVMTRLLVVHHTVSPATHELLESVLAGARAAREETALPGGLPLEIVDRPALAATVTDVLEADGFLLGTPANIGYMSGALKHFFDTIYYPTLTAKLGAPYGVWLHGDNDTTGAAKSVQTITGGLSWKQAAPVLEVLGDVQQSDREAAYDLGGTLAALLAP